MSQQQPVNAKQSYLRRKLSWNPQPLAARNSSFLGSLLVNLGFAGSSSSSRHSINALRPSASMDCVVLDRSSPGAGADILGNGVSLAAKPAERVETVPEEIIMAEPVKESEEGSHVILWSVSSELGYRNIMSAEPHPLVSNIMTSSFVRIPIHTEIEDIHWPSRADSDLWAAHGLGGDHDKFGFKFINGGVITAELDGTFTAASSDSIVDLQTDNLNNHFDIISESASIISNEFEAMNVDSSNNHASNSEASSDTESTLSSTNNSTREPQLPCQSEAPIHSSSNITSAARKSLPTTKSSRVFILADGHGGILAAKFFVPRTKAILTQILNSQVWDFSVASDRENFEAKACESFRVIDAEYCAIQVGRYRTWVDSGSDMQQRPDDDGCALVAVIVHDGWFVNLNVGDSRTLLAARPKRSENAMVSSPSASSSSQTSSVSESNWTPVFVSTDHNMTHPGKVYSIFSAGGHFMAQNHKIISLTPAHPTTRGKNPYTELANARIYRQPSPAVKSVGVSHRRTLNLTGTMGDLLFKIEPAVLTPVPDVSFYKMDASLEYTMVLATDGIWDHLMDMTGADVEKQCGMVLKIVGAAFESVEVDHAENLKAWEEYTAARREWKEGERKRRRLLRAAAAAFAGASSQNRIIGVESESMGIHGIDGDFAVAAEPTVLPNLVLNLNVDSAEQEDRLEVISDAEKNDSQSIASSNGSTAVASKDRSIPKSQALDEADVDEIHLDETHNEASASESLKRKLDSPGLEHLHQALKQDMTAEQQSNIEESVVLESVESVVISLEPRPEPKKPEKFDYYATLESRLRQVSDVLVQREIGSSGVGRIHPMILQSLENIFWQKQVRYDDATAFVAYFG